ncbi:MAG: ATP-dependent zinc protease family protein [Iamia sp.]
MPDTTPRRRRRPPRPTIGWREWVTLPDLGVPAIKAKVDTGAATSSLHAWNVTDGPPGPDDQPTLQFVLHPVQRDASQQIEVVAPLAGWRKVRSSNGQVEERPVIATTIALGEHIVPIEVTLTHRDEMGFRMLLGRAALRRRFLVDPGRSFLTRGPDADDDPADKVARP